MQIQINVPFYKVIVLSIGVFETNIIDERNFADLTSAHFFIDTIDKNYVSVLVEV